MLHENRRSEKPVLRVDEYISNSQNKQSTSEQIEINSSISGLKSLDSQK